MRLAAFAVPVAIFGAFVSVTTVAMAGDPREDSRAAFRDGVEAAQRGDYMRARGFFERAYKLFPHPSILLNRGIARAHTGDYVEAEQDLVNFLADDGGAPANEIASARSELALVRAHLGTFQLRVVPSGARARLDDTPVATIPGEFVDVRAPTGEHSLHIEAEGYAELDRRVDVDAASVHQLDVALAVRRNAHAADDGSGGEGISRGTTGWLLVGSGGALAILGTFAGVHALSLANGYNTPNSGTFQDQATKSSGVLFRTLADVSFVGALACGGAGAYFLLTPAKGGAQTAVVVGPAFSGVVGAF
jgi:PEGA domain